jgi:hypothetical protein
MQGIKNLGQSAIELILLFVTLFFFIITFLYVIQSNVAKQTITQYNDESLQIVSDIRDEITLAEQANEGYARSFNVPLSLLNKNYNITIVNQDIYLVSDDGKQAVSLWVKNVTGQIQKGTNVIRKSNGIIYLNN